MPRSFSRIPDFQATQDMGLNIPAFVLRQSAKMVSAAHDDWLPTLIRLHPGIQSWLRQRPLAPSLISASLAYPAMYRLSTAPRRLHIFTLSLDKFQNSVIISASL